MPTHCLMTASDSGITFSKGWAAFAPESVGGAGGGGGGVVTPHPESQLNNRDRVRGLAHRRTDTKAPFLVIENASHEDACGLTPDSRLPVDWPAGDLIALDRGGLPAGLVRGPGK